MNDKNHMMAAAAAQVRLLSRRRTVCAQGLDWDVLEAGRGEETLVFLPGTLGTVHIFSRQVLEFSSRYRVVVLGYPGECDIELMSASFFGVLRALGIPAAHFVGSSLGAFWLQEFSCARADFVQSLVLGNTFVDSRRLGFIKMFQAPFLANASAADVKGAWMDFVGNLPASDLKHFLLQDVGVEQDMQELVGRSFTIAHLGRVALSAVPPDRITLLTCDDDRVIAQATAQELADAYPGARHVRFDSGGHYPHVLNPVAYNEVVAGSCGPA
ncbi:MAG: alpha/beta hydrolase [Pseudomonadota bacterium]